MEISILFIHAVTHIGHLKLIAQTGASKTLVVLAALFSLIAMILSLIYISRELDHVISILIGFVVAAFLTEDALKKVNQKEIKQRV